jgi:lipoprotein-anchoring transpeptidase ErfK/SrfK
MRLREQSVLVAAMAGLVMISSHAAAQTPNSYPQSDYRAPYPQTDYRAGAGPDGRTVGALDRDEIASRPLPPLTAPQAERRHYYPTEQNVGRQAAPYPTEPGDDRTAAQPSIAAPEPYPEPQIVRRPPGYDPSQHGAMPPYPDGPTPGGIPSAGQDAAPPTTQHGLRPPAPIPTAPGTGVPAPIQPGQLAALPPEDQPEVGEPQELPPQFRRQIVDYQTKEPAGTIIIDTPSTFLYYVNGDGTAIRYGIGVGREGFTWSGTERITRMAEWPDWYPPAEMIERQPYLPRFMAGGPGNPLGARALYLGKTIYRVHGTNQPSTIGKFVSSGCIRMLNEDVEDLYKRVKIGTKVVVLAGARGPAASNAPASNASASR